MFRTGIAATSSGSHALARLWLALALAGCCAAGQAADLSWEIGGAAPSKPAWTAERGRIEATPTGARLLPDNGGRVILLSPPDLAQSTAGMETFALGVSAAGLQHVRVQGRRDARGGWITLADATGGAIRAVDGDIVIARNVPVTDGPVERLRIELSFRTTGAREITRIAVRGE